MLRMSSSQQLLQKLQSKKKEMAHSQEKNNNLAEVIMRKPRCWTYNQKH